MLCLGLPLLNYNVKDRFFYVKSGWWMWLKVLKLSQTMTIFGIRKPSVCWHALRRVYTVPVQSNFWPCSSFFQGAKHWWDHPLDPVGSSALERQGDTGECAAKGQEGVQGKAPSCLQGMAGSTVDLQLRREGSGASPQWTNSCREGTEETEFGCLCCLLPELEPLGTNETGVFCWTSGNIVLQWGWLSTSRGWPEKCGVH